MVAIRLTRVGRRKRPVYRVVVADSRSPRDGRFIEVLGSYDPLSNPPKFRIDQERTDYWVSSGAVMSDTVKSLCRRLKKTRGSG